VKINSNDDLDLKGVCLSRCDGLSRAYSFNLFMLDSNSSKWTQFSNQSYFHVSSQDETDLIILKSLFNDFYSQRGVVYWKVQMTITILTYSHENLTGMASILFQVNIPPTNGKCDVKPKYGSVNDRFRIYCTNWLDNDGQVASYSYYGNFADDSVYYGLGYSTSNAYTTRLFVGAVYDSYQMSVYVQVYDNDGAFTIYKIEENVTVVPDFSNFQVTINNLIARSPSFSINKILNEGSFLTSLQEIQAISSLLNEQSLLDKLGLLRQDNSESSYFPQVYGPLCNYGGVNAV